jgi:hypothetical protein
MEYLTDWQVYVLAMSFVLVVGSPFIAMMGGFGD